MFEVTRRRLKRGDITLALMLLASAAVYKPILLVAENNWDLGSPELLLGIALVVFTLETLVVAIAVIARSPLVPTALTVFGLTIVAWEWHNLPVSPWLWVAVVLILGVGSTRLRQEPRKLAAVVLAAAFALGPIAQSVLSFVREAEPYPALAMGGSALATPTGNVEDILVLIVDSYPSLAITREWFGHDTAPLAAELENAGFDVRDTSWSHHTFTGMSVPSLMELRPVVEEGSTGSWGNLRSMYEVARGDSFVVNSLRGAGFKYTHVEGGWDGGSCGKRVDDCIGDGWLNEASWELLRQSVLSQWLGTRYGHHSVPNTVSSADHLMALEGIFDDGNHDLVFAHFLLPHPPIAADHDCKVLDTTRLALTFDGPADRAGGFGQYLGHFSCVDKLLGDVAGVVGTQTAVLIAGDHGTGLHGQTRRDPATWSDSEIAERLGAFLAYRLPETCPSSSTDSSITAMRGIVSCAVEMEMPDFNGRYLIGAIDPVWVEAGRLERIATELRKGSLMPDLDG